MNREQFQKQLKEKFNNNKKEMAKILNLTDKQLESALYGRKKEHLLC